MADTAFYTKPDAPAGYRQTLIQALRTHARLLLLGVLPALGVTAGLALYVTGGRYVSTDNASIGEQKVLITPDISGKIAHIFVREGQKIRTGDALFDIDPTPFEITLRQARGKLDSVRADFANLKNNYQSYHSLVALGEQAVEIKRRNLNRRATLAANRNATEVDLDNARTSLLAAELQLEFARQQFNATANQLLGHADLPIEDFPAYRQAKAAVDQAARDLDHTLVKAPIAGTATQVDSIQLGRFVTAGTPVFSLIDDAAPWVDANPKETDIAHLKELQQVEIRVDGFPDRLFHGTVSSVGPGTGAQFAILPPQNANGNWVKVVQRVPVRVQFDPGQDVAMLRAGMSVTVDIDTGYRRSLASLFGMEQSFAHEASNHDDFGSSRSKIMK
ncbi:MAG TPA: HlyD family secretion protein [Methylocella sp.]|nr:HlyD family secretion protein [Methylocella sp.]